MERKIETPLAGCSFQTALQSKPEKAMRMKGLYPES